MSRKPYFLAMGAVFAMLGALVFLGWMIAARAGTSEAATFLAITTPFVGVLLALALAFAGGSKRSSRTPRIDNLRIAGKYSGKPAAMGTTPLDLRF